MAINYATKYASKIDERFSKESFTDIAVNKDFNFVGVKTVQVYSMPTASLSDYKRDGSNRYGTPTELANSLQELTMTKDRGFTFTIDKGNYSDTGMLNSAGLALAREIREMVVPEIDKYRFDQFDTNAGTSGVTVVTATNAYDTFLSGVAVLTENLVPHTGLVAFITPTFYKCIKLDQAFIRSSDMGQAMLTKGQVGMIDGIPIIVVPSSYLADGTNFMIVNRTAMTSPIKLAEYKIHDNPPGINGWLVEGRVYYDAFILNNKKISVYVSKAA